ncbi:PLP-dependent aspartate aminotransferase family protein [Labrenzia sp. DG1229]|uniref:trans-sulfuration enzyme family protein n=1 Tax=Labrenzia sp. DG1229 TaxID=681847 RepID=UPI000490E96E|nr:PLP-dependent aspartate aminotransferase family protein [Labrenzia sp. DG1229]
MNNQSLYPKGFRSLSVPTFRASTIPFDDYASYRDRGSQPRSGYSYGLAGTPTTRVLQDRITELEGASETFLVGSGLSAITTTFLAICRAGDCIALPDNVYPPVRRFATETLSRLAVETVYYDPEDPADQLDRLERARLLWSESPGSMTHEVVDFKALRRHADRLGAILGADNSWASPILCRPIEHGVEIVVEALSKHLSGHSDLLMGSISTSNEKLAGTVYEGGMRTLGVGVSPDDCFLALRGLETASLRIRQCGANALKMSEYLSSHEAIDELLYPAAPSSAAHSLYRSQFRGPGSVMTIVLSGSRTWDFDAMVSSLQNFVLGASWGGTHSILAPSILGTERTVNRSYCGKTLVRLGIGLEDPGDLKMDLEQFLGTR